MADTLTLQGLEIEIETQADTYRSDNSAYACVLTSAHSIVC
jgi:hypothetical protein